MPKTTDPSSTADDGNSDASSSAKATTPLSDRARRAIRQTAELIAQADALLVTSGAGMSVDSGLPDYRGRDGFWRAYPPLAHLGLALEDMAQPRWFDDQPDMAWAFYGHRMELYRRTTPHAGYQWLLEWGNAMPLGCFALTSNVDAHFHYADFRADRILEEHGNVHFLQCSRPCSPLIWQDELPDLKINLPMLRCFGKLPRCPECGAIARPNELMFEDTRYVDVNRRRQRMHYQGWLASVGKRRLVILEIGAGTALPTIRRKGELLAAERAPRATLVRINPAAREEDDTTVVLPLPALEALTRIREALPAAFLEKVAGANAPEPPRKVPIKKFFEMAREVFDEDPGAVLSTAPADTLRNLRWRRVHSKPFKFRLPRRRDWAWVERFDVDYLYAGVVDGGPGWTPKDLDRLVKQDGKLIVERFGGPDGFVLRPRLFDESSREGGLLPSLRFMAQVRSHAEVSNDAESSWMNLVWYANVDDSRTIVDLVRDALTQVDWQSQASGWSF
jgi:NAD-dependent SIR2 family protein deacetylase